MQEEANQILAGKMYQIRSSLSPPHLTRTDQVKEEAWSLPKRIEGTCEWLSLIVEQREEGERIDQHWEGKEWYYYWERNRRRRGRSLMDSLLHYN